MTLRGCFSRWVPEAAINVHFLDRLGPRERLCELPTPISAAPGLASAIGCGPLFVKADDLSARPIGGNKPRKLEWILGAAKRAGRRRVLTIGGLGTNHGLATATYARRLGMACDLVLVHQPVDDHVRARLLAFAELGADVFYGGRPAGAAALTLARLARHPRTLLVPPGGSSPLGTLGMVRAGLELADQIDAGLLPEPARVYVPLGTGGSAAGIAAGLALAGLRTRVVAVNVNDLMPPNQRALFRLARRSLRLASKLGAPAVDVARLALEIDHSALGPGYGHATPEGRAALASARDTGLSLDTTYTAKALAALSRRERGCGDPILLWNSYPGPTPAPDSDPALVGRLPKRLRRVFQG